MKNENYVLLKDLPDTKAGTIFYESLKGEYTCGNNRLHYKKIGVFNYYSIDLLKNNPDWFIKESEYKKRQEVAVDLFEIFSDIDLTKEERVAIKDTILLNPKSFFKKDKTNFRGMYLHHDKDKMKNEK